MPTFQVTDPDSGRTVRLTGDSPPTEAELTQIFSGLPTQGAQDGLATTGTDSSGVVQPALGDTAAQAPIAKSGTGIPLLDEAIGFEEGILSAITSAAAEPFAGVAGIAQGLNPFADPGASSRAVSAVREGLTFQPQTQEGIEGLQAAGGALAPVGEVLAGAEDFLGDAAFNATGSPAIAAAAKTLPTAVLEAIGGVGSFAKAGGRLSKTGKEALKVADNEVSKALVESAPDIDTIKDTSRAVYKEIEETGAKLKPQATSSLLKTVIRRANKENVDSVLTPKSARVVDQFKDELANRAPRNITDLDTMRKKAQIAAASVDPADARVGAIMIDEIDSFMDKMGASAFLTAAEEGAGLGKKYKTARNLWGRARRAELIQDAMDKAGRQASGFENGIRVQLRQILNNKKRSRFFTKDELSAMDDVVKGSNEQNILKLVGRLGFSEGQATNILGGLAGTAVLGPVTPVIGQISRGLAQRSTRKAAELSDALVKAGPDGKKVTEAYLKTTLPKNRKPTDLADLLVSSGSDIDDLLKSGNKATKEAAELAKGRKAFAQGATAGAAASTIGEEQ